MALHARDSCDWETLGSSKDPDSKNKMRFIDQDTQPQSLATMHMCLCTHVTIHRHTQRIHRKVRACMHRTHIHIYVHIRV